MSVIFAAAEYNKSQCVGSVSETLLKRTRFDGAKQVQCICQMNWLLIPKFMAGIKCSRRGGGDRICAKNDWRKTL